METVLDLEARADARPGAIARELGVTIRLVATWRDRHARHISV
ncbi:hypothetical protein [Corynebacterium pacaense]|nr:hypothetical protein [Corynebacterium pacaense]